MKVAIIGASGQLGQDLVRVFLNKGDEVFALTHNEVEVTDVDSVARCLKVTTPDIVVNTSAMHHVETCEMQSRSAFEINALGARNIAEVTQDLDCALIQISTDYVFGGDKRQPYVEEDLPRPLNSYGITKLAGEYFVRGVNPKHFVLRTSALYGTHPCRGKGGLNFVELMLKLARERGRVRVVADEIVSPTATSELARQIVKLSRSDAYGLYHATAEGSCSWFEFAREVFAATGTNVLLEPAEPGEFPAKVPRPAYSVLENRALTSIHLNCFRTWREGLHEHLEAIGVSTPTARR